MPELPYKVTVDLKQKKFFINGVEFPWYISEDGVDITAPTDSGELTKVSFTMFAAAAEVIQAGD